MERGQEVRNFRAVEAGQEGIVDELYHFRFLFVDQQITVFILIVAIQWRCQEDAVLDPVLKLTRRNSTRCREQTLTSADTACLRRLRPIL